MTEKRRSQIIPVRTGKPPAPVHRHAMPKESGRGYYGITTIKTGNAEQKPKRKFIAMSDHLDEVIYQYGEPDEMLQRYCDPTALYSESAKARAYAEHMFIAARLTYAECQTIVARTFEEHFPKGREKKKAIVHVLGTRDEFEQAAYRICKVCGKRDLH